MTGGQQGEHLNQGLNWGLVFFWLVVLFCTLPVFFFLLLMNIVYCECLSVPSTAVMCKKKIVIFYQIGTLFDTCTSQNIQIPLFIRYVYIKILNHTFYAPGLKGPPGASSNWIVCPFVCLSVRP